MTTEGEFVAHIPPSSATGKVLGITIVIAVLAGALAIAALALWVALTLIPIAIAAGLIGYGVLRYRLWRARRASLGGQRDLFPL